MKNKSGIEAIIYGIIYICLILPIKICLLILCLPFVLLAMCFGVEMNKGFNKFMRKK